MSSLLRSAIAIVVRQAVYEGLTLEQLNTSIGEAFNKIQPIPLPNGVTQDIYGALLYSEKPWARVFNEDAFKYAHSLQQIANIKMQVGLDSEGNHTASGMLPVGWEAEQVWNTFLRPLYRVTGIDEAGNLLSTAVDTASKPLYPRIRVRGDKTASFAALDDYKKHILRK